MKCVSDFGVDPREHCHLSEADQAYGGLRVVEKPRDLAPIVRRSVKRIQPFLRDFASGANRA